MGLLKKFKKRLILRSILLILNSKDYIVQRMACTPSNLPHSLNVAVECQGSRASSVPVQEVCHGGAHSCAQSCKAIAQQEEKSIFVASISLNGEQKARALHLCGGPRGRSRRCGGCRLKFTCILFLKSAARIEKRSRASWSTSQANTEK